MEISGERFEELVRPNLDIATGPGERGRVYTLGDLLDVWGVTDVATMAGAYGSTVRVSVEVDGRSFTGDPRTIPLGDRARIAVLVTAPTGAG